MYIFETDGDYVNFNGGGNLWRIHKNSQCVAWHWDETGDLFFDVYDQQYVVKAENIATVTIGGVVLSTAADFETNIKLVFPGLAGGGTSSYLVYTALLTQTSTNTPIATVLENTLGGTVTWVRNGMGDYYCELTGVFTVNKTVVFVQDTQTQLLTAWAALSSGVNTLSFTTYFAPDGSLSDDVWLSTPLEIRVYP